MRGSESSSGRSPTRRRSSSARGGWSSGWRRRCRHRSSSATATPRWRRHSARRGSAATGVWPSGRCRRTRAARRSSSAPGRRPSRTRPCMPITVAQLYRYPVKGLGAEPLDTVTLAASGGAPHDRRFAIARGDSRLDAASPRWRPKEWFIMLMRDTELARVTCRLDVAAGTVALGAPGRQACVAQFGTAEGRAQLEAYVNAALGTRREGPARFVEAGDVSFTDVPQNCLSVINLESIRDAGTRMGVTLDPLRFRANVYLAGVAPWAEFTWVGRDIRIGEVTLHVPARIPRCNATAVNPATGERDVNVVKGLRAQYGHYDMGVYAEVRRGGRMRVGDTVDPPLDPTARSRAGHWFRFFGFLARGARVLLRRGERPSG